jgi:transposase-like protein
MMDADAGVRCNAGYGEVTPDPVNSHNGYRRWERDTRAGTVELALASVVSMSYMLGISTRRVEKPAASLGVIGLSKSQVNAEIMDALFTGT